MVFAALDHRLMSGKSSGLLLQCGGERNDDAESRSFIDSVKARGRELLDARKEPAA